MYATKCLKWSKIELVNLEYLIILCVEKFYWILHSIIFSKFLAKQKSHTGVNEALPSHSIIQITKCVGYENRQ